MDIWICRYVQQVSYGTKWMSGYVDMYKKCHTESNGCMNSQCLSWFSRQHTADMIRKQMLQLFVHKQKETS